MITTAKFVFDILNGSNGKLTLAEHKASVLLVCKYSLKNGCFKIYILFKSQYFQGIGNLSYNTMKETDFAQCFIEISKLFFKVLETESHEKTLCYCLDMFTLWGRNLVGELPSFFIENFKVSVLS